MKYDDMVDTGWIGTADSVGDMQIHLTHGYPVVVFYDFSRACLWLEPIDVMEQQFVDQFNEAFNICRRFGVRTVFSNRDVNKVLEELEGDALDWLLEDEE